MNEARPHLVAVEGEGQAEPGAPGPEAPRRTFGTTALVAGLLAVIFAVGWAVSARDGRALRTELASTQARLEASEARVGALEGHLGQVQERTGSLVEEMGRVMGSLGALAGDLEALGALAGQDPQAPGPAAESAPEAGAP